MKLQRWIFTAIVLTIVWLFVRGVAVKPMPILGEVLFGGLVAISVAGLFRRMYAGTVNISHGIRTLPQTIVYVGTFLRELLVANFDVAYRVLWPTMPIEPVVIYLPLRVERPIGISTIANSISLTPGTLTMDYDDETNALYVHAINGTDPDAVVAPIRRWEDLALIMYGEDADPDDPAPEYTLGGDER